MKKKFVIAVFSLIIILVTSIIVYTYPGGISGRTKKTSTTGCGSCHSQNTNIVSAITGPDTVTAGATVNFTVTITRSGSTAKAGMDIATRLGTLGVGPSSAYLQLSSGELIQKQALNLTAGTFTCQFAYTAPAAAGTDTIWLTSAVGHSNGWNWGTEKRVIVRTLTPVNNQNTPVQFKLNQNYPNPFNPSTTIRFELPTASGVKITVMDINGKYAETLLNREMTAGNHEVTWNAQNFASGIYFYKFETGSYEEVKKMMLIK